MTLQAIRDNAPSVSHAAAEVRFQFVPRPSPYTRFGKRLLDLAVGIPMFLVALPIIAALALLCLAASGWPPFYAAVRVGKDGRPFRMWKLRTMVRNADSQLSSWLETRPDLAGPYLQSFKLHNDPRVTTVGRFLRRTSLDELPQLWNVVRGNMSLVGPRPICAQEVELYGSNVRVLLSARPGVTGAWQTGGRNSIDYPERAGIELKYVVSQSLAQDLRILARTIPTLLRVNGI